MDQALNNTVDERLDGRTAQRTRMLFAVTFCLAVLASPVFVLYELLIGTLGLVALGMVARVREGSGIRAATVIAAGLIAGSLPYLLTAAFVS
jgi:hypothetical protein